MKRGVAFLLFVFLLIVPMALCQENRFVIHFHSITGSESVTINLWDYFGKGVIPVVSKTENLKVDIDHKTGDATITVINPEFRGIEEVVFAIAEEYLEEEEEEPSKFVVPWNRSKLITDLGGEDIADPIDAFSAQQFNTMIGSLEGESVSITATKRRSTVGVLMGEQLFMNISYDLTANYTPPALDLKFRLEDTNRTMREVYTEPSEIVFFSLSVVILASLIVLIFYIYYAYMEDLRVNYTKMLFAKKKTLTDVSIHKRAALAELGVVRSRIGKDRPSSLYRQTIAVMNKFLAKALKIRGSNITAITMKLEKMGATRAQINKITMYFTRYRDRPYSAKD